MSHKNKTMKCTSVNGWVVIYAMPRLIATLFATDYANAAVPGYKILYDTVGYPRPHLVEQMTPTLPFIPSGVTVTYLTPPEHSQNTPTIQRISKTNASGSVSDTGNQDRTTVNNHYTPETTATSSITNRLDRTKDLDITEHISETTKRPQTEPTKLFVSLQNSVASVIRQTPSPSRTTHLQETSNKCIQQSTKVLYSHRSVITHLSTIEVDKNYNFSQALEELKINRKSTSKATRRFRSADDSRGSAKAMGMGAILVILSIAVCIVLMDVPTLRKQLRWLRCKSRKPTNQH